MRTKRAQRLAAACLILLGMGCATGFVLYALRQNITLFYTPTQIIQDQISKNHTIRMGGLVEKGSVHAVGNDHNNAYVSFKITDFNHEITVLYNGILPDLFREGQGVVVRGHLQKNHFMAEEVLAKHDENYMPPEVAEALHLKDLS